MSQFPIPQFWGPWWYLEVVQKTRSTRSANRKWTCLNRAPLAYIALAKNRGDCLRIITTVTYTYTRIQGCAIQVNKTKKRLLIIIFCRRQNESDCVFLEKNSWYFNFRAVLVFLVAIHHFCVASGTFWEKRKKSRGNFSKHDSICTLNLIFAKKFAKESAL